MPFQQNLKHPEIRPALQGNSLMKIVVHTIRWSTSKLKTTIPAQKMRGHLLSQSGHENRPSNRSDVGKTDTNNAPTLKGSSVEEKKAVYAILGSGRSTSLTRSVSQAPPISREVCLSDEKIKEVKPGAEIENASHLSTL